jgi:hypothetical protein
MSHKLSHEQKRKAKLAKRREKAGPPEPTPYEGSKYRADSWAPYVSATEEAIYDVIVLSECRLTNDAVRQAFIALIHHLRSKAAAALPADAPEVAFNPAEPVPHLIYKMRLAWRGIQENRGPVRNEDWVGILRTLLYSMQAQSWHLGASRGYVVFLKGYMERFSAMR